LRAGRRAAAAAAAADGAPAPPPPPRAPSTREAPSSVNDLSYLQKNVHRHTLNDLYIAPEDRIQPIPTAHWGERRRARERAEIAEAGARLRPSPLSARQVASGLDSLEALLPGVPVGSLDLLKASEWARVAADPPRAAQAALALRSAFPRADAAAIIRRAPRLALLRDPAEVARDAAAARAVLDPTLGRDDVAAVDAAVELVPELATPRGVAVALGHLRKWHPKSDPYELIRKDPTVLVNQDESDLEADPSYGEVSSAG
jgi:hypothetical protein